MATRTEVVMVLSRLAVGWPEVVISPPMIEAWCEDFAKIPGEHMLAAALEIRQRSKGYFPRIGEVYERAETLWNRATEDARSRVVKLEEPRPDPDDPRIVAARDAIARKLRMDRPKPEEPAE